jgi:hypothetical protein
MAKKPTKKSADTRVSLAPLTPEQALAGLLKVKPADLKKVEAKEAAKKKGRR